MFTNDLISSVPTDNYNAKQAYAAYWAVATSECNELGNGAGPVYRFARDLMLRAVMREYKLTVAQVAWLYDELLPEGPGWGSLDDMVAYGVRNRFGETDKARARFNCLTCRAAYEEDNEDLALPSNAHAIDCPERI